MVSTLWSKQSRVRAAAFLPSRLIALSCGQTQVNQTTADQQREKTWRFERKKKEKKPVSVTNSSSNDVVESHDSWLKPKHTSLTGLSLNKVV